MELEQDRYKSVRKSLRITEQQNEFLLGECKAYGVNESVYIRGLLDEAAGKRRKNTAKTKEETAAILQLVAEVNYIGKNINQIVKNTNIHFYTEREKRKLFAMMENIKVKVAALKE